MSEKRPWTPSRLLGNGMVIYHPDEYEAARLLNEKAPEMAELLIELFTGIDDKDDFNRYMVRVAKLLKEVGYANED